MPRRFQFSLIWVVIAILATVGIVVDRFERSANRRHQAEQSRELESLAKRVEVLTNETKKTEAELQDQIRRMSQRPPRGKIEDTLDKFDDPADITLPSIEPGSIRYGRDVKPE